MIDQLIKLVRQNAADTVINNPAVPNEKNDAVIHDIGENIAGGLKDQAAQGKIDALADMFRNGSPSSLANNSAVSGIIAKVVSSLSSKFGISPQIAQHIASALLPKVMGQFVNKANNPDDHDFNVQDIVKNLGTGNASELLGKITGNADLLGGLGKMFGR